MTTLLCCLFLFQQDVVRRSEQVLILNATKARDAQEQQLRLMQDEKRVFEKRFNKLVDALRRFTDEYNKGRGNVWPLQEAEALQNAYRDLQRSPFFKTPRRGKSDVDTSEPQKLEAAQ